jgi:hypothetical protein
MTTDYSNIVCCPDVGSGCYVIPCDGVTTATDWFQAVAFISGVEAPLIGDTVDINGTATTLTSDNYFDNIIKWVKELQYNCSTTINGQYNRVRVTFLNRNQVKGTRPKSTKKQSDMQYDGSIPAAVGVEAETTYQLKAAFFNQCWINSMLYDEQLSCIINFMDRGIEVLNRNEYAMTTIDGGLDWKGDNKAVTGDLIVKHEGPRDFCPYQINESLQKAYYAALKDKTSFTFNKANVITTGLTPKTCDSGSCLEYYAEIGVPFSFQNKTVEDSACGKWTLLQNCHDTVDASLPIMIDEDAGINESTGFPVAGKYAFTVVFENDCCISGSYCINIVVR